MAARSYASKLITAADFLNLARSYRQIATQMPAGKSRDRMLLMARAAESRAKKLNGTAPTDRN